MLQLVAIIESCNRARNRASKPNSGRKPSHSLSLPRIRSQHKTPSLQGVAPVESLREAERQVAVWSRAGILFLLALDYLLRDVAFAHPKRRLLPLPSPSS